MVLKDGNYFTKGADGTFTALTDLAAVNSTLASFGGDATELKGGMMYYAIPIEHLNPAGITVNGDTRTVPEGKYGVVRNHHYVLTINTVDKAGVGVFDPDTQIVPTDEDKDLYYLGVKVNILSWKIVSQSVNL